MHNVKRHRAVQLLCAGIFLCGPTSAQQPASEQATLPPLPPPIYEPTDLPPLPPPTEQQLQRGRELLDKIVYVIGNVPLTDAAAVLKVFGFTNLHAVTFPTYTWVGPKGKDNDFAQPAEMTGAGFSHIQVQPWVSDPNHTVTARLSTTLAPKELCISIGDVRRVFEPIASRVSKSRVIDIHPVERPAPLHGVGILSFSPLKNRPELETSVTFRFEYQTCAKSFNFVYFKEPNK